MKEAPSDVLISETSESGMLAPAGVETRIWRIASRLWRYWGSHLTTRSKRGRPREPEEVGSPILFYTLIFMIAFVPLFTMRGVEGAIFSPRSAIGGQAVIHGRS